MVLVGEIIERLRRDGKNAVEAIRLENYADIVRHPHVEDGPYIVYTPGFIDAESARLVVTIGGCEFIRVKNDPLWRPKTEDDLLGVKSFVSSSRFVDFPYAVTDVGDRTECRNVVLRIITDLLNDCYAADRLFSLEYGDFAVSFEDYEIIRKELERMRYVGYTYDTTNGCWRGSETGGFVPSVCALALLESLDGRAGDFFYAEIPMEDYNMLVEVLQDCESAPSKCEIRTFLRSSFTAKSVWVLSALDLSARLLERIHKSRNAKKYIVERTIGAILEKYRKRMKRRCAMEEIYMDLQRHMRSLK